MSRLQSRNQWPQAGAPLAPMVRRELRRLSVLLRQAHRFEGFLPRLVHDHPLDCSVADCPHIDATSSHLDPATPLHVLGPGHYYEITGFDEFVGLQPSGFPGLAEVLRGSPNLIKSEDAAPRTGRTRPVHHAARSRVFDHGIPVLAVPRVVPGLDDLHVLLRHRLLREACGFEGFASVPEEHHPYRSASVEGDDLVEHILRLGAARLSGTSEAYAGEQPVAVVDYLFRFVAQLAEYIAEHPPERLDALITSVDLAIRRNAGRVEYHLGVHRRKRGVPVTVVVRRLGPPEGFNGFVRHRPRSIPQAQDSV